MFVRLLVRRYTCYPPSVNLEKGGLQFDRASCNFLVLVAICQSVFRNNIAILFAAKPWI